MAVPATGCQSDTNRSRYTVQSLDDLMRAFVDRPPVDRQTVETVLGTELPLESANDLNYPRLDSGRALEYAAHDVRFEGVRIKRVQYEAPPADQDGRRTLDLTLAEPCVPQNEILARYPQMKIGQVYDASFSEWWQQLSWGRLFLDVDFDSPCVGHVIVIIF